LSKSGEIGGQKNHQNRQNRSNSVGVRRSASGVFAELAWSQIPREGPEVALPEFGQASKTTARASGYGWSPFKTERPLLEVIFEKT
jgi:hypothetical protein